VIAPDKEKDPVEKIFLNGIAIVPR